MVVLGEALLVVPGLRSAPCIFHSGTQDRGAAVAFWGEGTLRVESRSWGESKEEEGKLFRLFKASARKIIIIIKLLPGCAIGCVCPHSKGITQPHLKSVKWGRMLHLLEAMAKAKKE